MRALTRFASLLVCGCSVLSGYAEDPDLIQVLTEVDAATRAVSSVSYHAKIWTEGEIDLKQPRIEVSVKAQEGGGGRLPLFYIDGVVIKPDRAEGEPFTAIMNDKQAIMINPSDKTYSIGNLPQGMRLIREAFQSCVMQEFVHPAPFSDELNATSRRYEGRQTITGIDCHVIFVVYRGGTESRWYFGINDNLPHRVDRISKVAGKSVARVLELSDLNTSPKFDADTFKIEIPEGFKERQPKLRVTSSPGLLPAGTLAPDWSLKTPEDNEVVLSKLRGKIVLLDFWATWCGPCKRRMPDIQKINDLYKDKPVAVYGISTFETGDPVKYMRNEKYTYGLLLNGDRVAKKYGVGGLPSLYLIGPDGKVIFAVSGFSSGHEKTLRELIDAELEQMKSP